MPHCHRPPDWHLRLLALLHECQKFLVVDGSITIDVCSYNCLLNLLLCHGWLDHGITAWSSSASIEPLPSTSAASNASFSFSKFVSRLNRREMNSSKSMVPSPSLSADVDG